MGVRMWSRALGRALRRRPRLLVLVDLVQDIDVLLPVMLALRADGVWALRIVVSRWLAEASPRTAGLLKMHGLHFRYVPRRAVVEGSAPNLAGVSAMLTASESSDPAHAAGHALARRAKAGRLAAFTLQHGLENIGLLGVEAGAAVFASDVIFCWFPAALTPPGLAPETRAKLVHAGRPAPVGGWSCDARPAFDLGVFENLHWSRYSEADRRAFQEGLLAVARALPDTRILFRPHPAGGWGDDLRHELAHFPHISVASAADSRENLGGPAQVLRGLGRVITTPSTVALDAALAGAPTALACPGGSLYAPLPVLQSPDDWVAFAASRLDDESSLDQFRARVLVKGDGVRPIVERMREVLSNPPKFHE